jgi:hypothetical protein
VGTSLLRWLSSGVVLSEWSLEMLVPIQHTCQYALSPSSTVGGVRPVDAWVHRTVGAEVSSLAALEMALER